jgi:hypothetical protein
MTNVKGMSDESVGTDPAYFLAYVQGILGYRLIQASENSWYFQRDEPFER